MTIKTGFSIYFPKYAYLLSLYGNYQDYLVPFFLDHHFSQNKPLQVCTTAFKSYLQFRINLNNQLVLAEPSSHFSPNSLFFI